jgi:hypothetical protein
MHIRTILVLWSGTVLLRAQAPVSIAGQIDAAKAMQFLYHNYDAKTQSSSTGRLDTDPVVSVVATQQTVLDGQRVFFLYTSSNTKHNDCHACSVHLNAVLFRQQPSGWERWTECDLGEGGSYGQPPGIQPVLWGRQAHGIVRRSGWTGMGEDTASDTLMAFEGGTFRDVFSIQVEGSNGGTLLPDSEKYAFSMAWRFTAPAPNGYLDIEVTAKTDNRYPGPKDRASIPAPGVYRYDGTQYRHRKTGAPLPRN